MSPSTESLSALFVRSPNASFELPDGVVAGAAADVDAEHRGALGHVRVVHQQARAVGAAGQDDDEDAEERRLVAALFLLGLLRRGGRLLDRLGQLRRGVRQRPVGVRSGPERRVLAGVDDRDAAGQGVPGDVVPGSAVAAGSRVGCRLLRGEDRGVVAETAAQAAARISLARARVRVRVAGTRAVARCRREAAGSDARAGRGQQRAVTGDRTAGRAGRAALGALGEVGEVVAARFARTAVRADDRERTRVAQRSGDVEGPRATAVAGSHGSGAGGAGQAGAVRAAAVRPAGADPAGDAQRARAAGRRRPSGAGPVARRAALTCGAAGARGPGGSRTDGQSGPVGRAAALAALGGTGLAGGEPVAGLLLRPTGLVPGRCLRGGGHGRGRGGDRRGGGRGRARTAGRRCRTAVRAVGALGGCVGVRDGCADDHRRDGP